MSAWMDRPALVMRRKASLLDNSSSGIPAAEFLSYLADLDESPDSFAFRWAATAGEDGRMKLQAAPSSSLASLYSKGKNCDIILRTRIQFSLKFPLQISTQNSIKFENWLPLRVRYY
jgi:hypothetical protein